MGMTPNKYDYELVRRAVREVQDPCTRYEGVRLECFNKEEADMLKAMIKERDPNIIVNTTWCEWS